MVITYCAFHLISLQIQMYQYQDSEFCMAQKLQLKCTLVTASASLGKCGGREGFCMEKDLKAILYTDI